jgi:hypothetical protein
MTPIFLASLPRSGSTFVQRVLAAHDDIATVSEPWLLLPFFYALRPLGAYAEYGHELATIALHDFCAQLPQGVDDYRAALREFALHLYAKAAPGAVRYFLDKTPRYHLVLDDLFATFPEAKFVFLWRNPLAAVASIIESDGHGRLELNDHYIDLYLGLANLVRAYEAHADRVWAVRYEDLITRPDETWPALFAHLELDYDAGPLARFKNVVLAGRFGDQIGGGRYDALSTEPLDKWRSVLTNPLRRAWCDRYLRWIGAHRLELMGYRLDELRTELRNTSVHLQGLAPDLLRLLRGAAIGLFELKMMKDKFCDPRPGSSCLTPHR